MRRLWVSIILLTTTVLIRINLRMEIKECFLEGSKNNTRVASSISRVPCRCHLIAHTPTNLVVVLMEKAAIKTRDQSEASDKSRAWGKITGATRPLQLLSLLSTLPKTTRPGATNLAEETHAISEAATDHRTTK